MSGIGGFGITVVGYGREATVPANGKPCAASLKVPSPEDIRLVGPPVCRLRRACMKLVAVGGENQWIVRMLADAQDDQAHA